MNRDPLGSQFLNDSAEAVERQCPGRFAVITTDGAKARRLAVMHGLDVVAVRVEDERRIGARVM